MCVCVCVCVCVRVLVRVCVCACVRVCASMQGHGTARSFEAKDPDLVATTSASHAVWLEAQATAALIETLCGSGPSLVPPSAIALSAFNSRLSVLVGFAFG